MSFIFGSTSRFFSPIAVASVASVSALLLLAASPQAARAQLNVQNNGGTTNYNGYAGQSVTTTSGGPFNNIVFNFYAPDLNGGAAIAPGTIYLLTQTYAGAPSNLTTSTAGYLARVTGANGLYTFDSSVTLQESTQYFFYVASDGNGSYGYGLNLYSGGNAYVASAPGNNNTNVTNRDFNFRLQGTTVTVNGPEPSTLPLLGMGLSAGLVMAATVKRRKAKQPAA